MCRAHVFSTTHITLASALQCTMVGVWIAYSDSSSSFCGLRVSVLTFSPMDVVERLPHCFFHCAMVVRLLVSWSWRSPRFMSCSSTLCNCGRWWSKTPLVIVTFCSPMLVALLGRWSWRSPRFMSFSSTLCNCGRWWSKSPLVIVTFYSPMLVRLLGRWSCSQSSFMLSI